MSERDLFIEALQRPDPAERAAYLDRACNSNAALRQRVEVLLEAHAGASECLKAPAPFDAATSQMTPEPPTDGTKHGSPSDRPSTEPYFEAPGDTGTYETRIDSSPHQQDLEDAPEWAGPPQFEILGVLGRGGMGVVFKARHRQLNRVVALKMILEGKYAGPEHRARFLIEAEAIARLRHPNIVQIYDIGEADGRPYVTLELLEGGSLADRLKGTTQSGRAAAELVTTLALAMNAAHEAGIIHRDLKPLNILFDGDGVARITDFGLAKRLEIEDGQ